MAFPTTPLLDNFNRANANPLTGLLWVNQAFSSSDSNMSISSNVVAAAGGNGAAYWNHVMGPDCEVYEDLPTLVAVTQSMVQGARIKNPAVDATINCYQCYWNNTSTQTVKFFYNINSVFTQVGSTFNQVFAAGNRVGFSVVGNVLTAYLNTSGTWSSVTTATDSGANVPGSGFIAMELDDTTGRIDNFGGGTVNQVADICSQQMDRPDNTKTVILPI